MPSTDIVVPVFNERATVEELVTRLKRTCPDASIIFVDNASTDGTADLIAMLPGVRLIRHQENLGYGRSIADGIEAGTGEDIVILDADLEYQPEDVPAMLRALETTPAVCGSRFLGVGSGERVMPWVRATGNRVITTLFNLLYGQRLTDLCTGIRALRRSAYPTATPSDGFVMVLELSARLALAGVQIAEVPARYVPRSVGRSKMRHVPEFLTFAYRLLELRIGSRVT